MTPKKALARRLEAIRAIRTLGLAVAASMALSACGTTGDAPSTAATPGAPSKYGAYLAGRFASKQRDNEAAAKYFDDALGFDPGNEQLLERLLVSNIAAGDLNAASESAAALLQKQPTNRLARLVNALRLFRDGKFAEARVVYEGIEGKSLSELGNRFGAAWSYVGERNPDAAIKVANGLLGAQGLEAFAVYHKALLEDAGGRPQDALKTMALAHKVADGGSLRVVLHYGAMLERAGDRAKAKAVYDAYLTKSPDHPIVAAMAANLGRSEKAAVATPGEGLAEVYYSIANALNQDTAVDLSIFYTQIALALNPNDELAITLLGERLQTAGRYDESTEAFRRIPRGSPVFQNAQLQIGANLAKLEKTDDAIRVLTGALTGGPLDVELHATIGDTYREKERFADADAAYSKAVALIGKPAERHWVLFYTRGVSRERLKRWSEAEADLEVALKLKPNQPLVMNYLAYTWIEHGVNRDKALDMLHKAVELREDDGYIVDSLGWAYYRRGEFAKAVKFLERAILLEPSEATINDHLGDAFWRVGRQLEAKFQWNHALRLKPDDDEIPRIKRKLELGLDVVEADERAKAQPKS